MTDSAIHRINAFRLLISYRRQITACVEHSRFSNIELTSMIEWWLADRRRQNSIQSYEVSKMDNGTIQVRIVPYRGIALRIEVFQEEPMLLDWMRLGF